MEEIAEARRGRGSVGLDDVVAAVAAVVEVPAHVLRGRRCRNRPARDLLMAAARQYCRGLMTQSAMARALGLSLGGFIQASGRGDCAKRENDAKRWGEIVMLLTEMVRK